METQRLEEKRANAIAAVSRLVGFFERPDVNGPADKFAGIVHTFQQNDDAGAIGLAKVGCS